MKHSFFIIFFMFFIACNTFSESKYHKNKDLKKKEQIKEEFVPKTFATQEDGASPAQSIDLTTDALLATKRYWMGIIFYPKTGQLQDSELEDKFFKAIADAYNRTETLKLHGSKIFKQKLVELKISERSIVLSPQNAMGMPGDINGIVVITYLKDPLDSSLTVEIKYIDAEGGNIYKLNPDIIPVKTKDAKIAEISQSLAKRILGVIVDNYKVKETSSDTAEEYYKKGKTYNVNKLYAQAARELEKAIRVSPKMTKAFIELAFSVYANSQDRKKQLEVLERGVKINPNDLELRLELAKLYSIIKEKELARKEYNYIIIMDKEGKTIYSKEAERLIEMLNYE